MRSTVAQESTVTTPEPTQPEASAAAEQSAKKHFAEELFNEENNPGTHQEVTRAIPSGEGGFSSDIRDTPPLYIPTAKSPREAIKDFNTLTAGIRDVFKQDSYYGDIDWQHEQELIDLYSKLSYLLDTSTLAPADAYARTNIIASQLSEILDRIYVPDLDEIPGDEEVARQKLEFWSLPYTQISLSQIQEGPRKGDWVFSADTVEKTDKFYERAQFAPYRPDAVVGQIGESGGLVDYYIDYTGPLLPTNFTASIPMWMRIKFLGDPIWKYFGTALIILFLLIIAWVVKRLTRYRSDHEANPKAIGRQVRRLILPVFLCVLLPVCAYIIAIDVRLRLVPLAVTDDILWGAFYLCAFWLCVCIANLISAIIIHSPEISSFGLDASLVRLCARLVAYVVGFWIVYEGLKDLGVSLVPLIAGVSVSGLAFALAARPTLGNLLSGALIFADKPFKIGERVVVGKHDGIVEEIGLRSTRIRTLDGHLVTVPNEEVSNNFIENIAQRPYIKRLINITLTYDTPPEKIKQAIEILRHLLSVDEDDGKDAEELDRPPNTRINSEDFPPRVFFNDFNADSLNLLVIYWYLPPDYMEFLDHSTWLNIQIVERFNQAGIDFAFPTQTIDLQTAADKKAPEASGEAVDDKVSHPGIYRSTLKKEDTKDASNDDPDETIKRLAGSDDDRSEEEKELEEAVEKKAAEESAKS